MYKINDIVWIKSIAGEEIPNCRVKLIERIETKASKGTIFNWPAHVGWRCILIDPDEAALLKKEWSIPFKFPDQIETFVAEENIIEKVKC